MELPRESDENNQDGPGPNIIEQRRIGIQEERTGAFLSGVAAWTQALRQGIVRNEQAGQLL